MAKANRISAELEKAAMDDIRAAVAVIEQRLPFLQSLTNEERKKGRKQGTKRVGYVTKVGAGVKTFPQAMPSVFPTGEYLKDVALYTPLAEVHNMVGGVFQKIDDTMMVLGMELMANTDNAYDALKSAVRNDSAVKPVVDEIKAALKQKNPPPAPQ